MYSEAKLCAHISPDDQKLEIVSFENSDFSLKSFNCYETKNINCTDTKLERAHIKDDNFAIVACHMTMTRGLQRFVKKIIHNVM